MIQIHEIAANDKVHIEKELGGLLRPVEFIYKEPGVNKPLTSEDDEKKNLNNTKYRIQINKVANAIKEIIEGLKAEPVVSVKEINQLTEPLDGVRKESERKKLIIASMFHQKSKKRLIILLSVFFCIIGAHAILKFISSRKQTQALTNLEKTIAVLPFRNLSNDTTQLYFCDGFMAEILNDLQKVKSFTVRSRTSSDQYRDTKKSSIAIGNELNVNYLVEGSVEREGNNLKIWVQLIDSKADKPVWSNDYPSEMKQLFSLQSEIAKDIATELKAILSPEEIKKIEKKPTENPEAYNYYLQGNYYLWRGSGSRDDRTAIELYEKAIGLDPGFALAYTGIARCLLDQYWSYYDHTEDIKSKSKQAIDKAFEIDPDLPDAHLALGLYYYWGYYKYPEALKQFELVLKDQPKSPEVINYLAAVHRRAGNWEMAKSEYEKAVELNPGRSDIAFNAGETSTLLLPCCPDQLLVVRKVIIWYNNRYPRLINRLDYPIPFQSYYFS